jgi:hypothetical protein
LKPESPGKEPEADLVLVRVDGDPMVRPDYFVEKDGDRRVKAVMESCLGLKIGPFETWVERY